MDWDNLYALWQAFYPTFDNLWALFFDGGSRLLLFLVNLLLALVGLNGWVGPIEV